jgi:hypothetical protein
MGCHCVRCRIGEVHRHGTSGTPTRCPPRTRCSAMLARIFAKPVILSSMLLSCRVSPPST